MLKSITQKNFQTEVLKSAQLVIVDYWSPTCGPCEMYNTVLEQMIPHLPTNIKIVAVNVDEELKLADQEQILVMPTTKVYHQGQCVKDIWGVQTKENLNTLIESLRS